MELLYSLCVGVMTFSGVFLCLRGRTFPVVMGLMMLGYAVNLFLLRRPSSSSASINGHRDWLCDDSLCGHFVDAGKGRPWE